MSARKTVFRVNLIPRSERDRRKRARAVRLWSTLAIAATVLSIGLVGGAWYLSHVADQRLDEEQALTGKLSEGLQQYHDVSGALGIRDALSAMRVAAMGSDTAWGTVVQRIGAVLPEDTSISGFSLTAGATPADGVAPQDAAGQSGTIELRAPRSIDLVSVARAVRGAEGVRSVDARSMEDRGDGTFRAALTIEYDQTVYTGAFAGEAR
ncbi:hypothetical protein [Microbacterium sp. No. 7]|uniref:hypothetical protein n=1 Tax=Microbacterium sp. No. 7 TaxID=1714373 RepID=UPI0006D05E31|nr:hypothetical protein [Microbacterium sp. No. 7]ALJ18744.1 hypothetical protein AOA12_01975 [Microbacterium sp. No. 7]